MDWQMMRDLALLAPHITPTTGNIYFVHATLGNTTNPGTSSVAPLSTWAAAYAKCTANHGDTVIILPGHTETLAAVTAGMSLNIAGVQTVGLGWGRSKPAFTASAVALDAISVTTANNRVSNIRIIGAAACTALVDIAPVGDDFELDHCTLEHGAAPVIAITAVAGADRFNIHHNEFRGTAAGPTTCLTVEGVCLDWQFCDNFCDYTGSAGLDTACVTLGANLCLGFLVARNIAIACDAAFFVMTASTAAITQCRDGLLAYNNWTRSATTAAANTNYSDLGGAGSIQNFCAPCTGNRRGNVFPTASLA